MKSNSKILVTGAAGFIGYHLSMRLLAQGHEVFGIDSLNAYYDVDLKRDRLRQLLGNPMFRFAGFDIGDEAQLDSVFRDFRPSHVVHLAAQAGVRYGLQNPHSYVRSNVIGFFSVLECCRKHPVEHLLYASSSSVYGGLKKLPFSISAQVDHPLSFYAATKKSNELFAHAYSYLHAIPSTGMRFFTAYGPWGRPDMAYFSFVDAIENERPIQVYAHGNQTRDFTYIDDIIEAIIRLLPLPPKKEDLSLPELEGDKGVGATYRVVNIGNNHPVPLNDFIEEIENALGKKAKKILCDAVQGDVSDTHADIAELTALIGVAPTTPINVGVAQFVAWYRDYVSGRKTMKIDNTPRMPERQPLLGSLGISQATYPSSTTQSYSEKLSFVIRNRGESEWIGMAIQSIYDHCGVDSEIVVVDDNSADGSREIVDMFLRQYNNIRVVELGRGSSYTPGRALNVGIQTTKSGPDRIICVLSAHCQVTRLNPASLFAAFEANQDLFAICGKQIPVYRGKRVDPHSVWLNFAVDGPRINPVEIGSQEQRYFFHNAFSFIRRTIWERYPFDEDLTSKEDRAYALKLVNQVGGSFLIDSEFQCLHFWTKHGATWRRDYALAPIPPGKSQKPD